MNRITGLRPFCFLFGLVVVGAGLARAAPPPDRLAAQATIVPAEPNTTRLPSPTAEPEAIMGEAIDAPLVNSASILGPQAIPIDLESAFRLAGVENPEIRIAMQRVGQAVAERQFAAAQILPSVNAGSNYDNHTGNLQQSNGNILAVNRSALYAGAGANAIAAGTVNIPGLVWNTNISVAVFNYLQSRQTVAERQAANFATNNAMLLQVAVAYLELMRAEQSRAIAIQIREEAKEVARLTANYAAIGQGRQADADRAATEYRQRDMDVLSFESDILTNAARLAQLLNLDPSIRLQPIDNWAVPRPLIPDAMPLPELIAIGLVQRPELAERRAVIQRGLLELNSAKMLPLSPNVIVGFSAGTFGGGSNLVTPVFGSFAARSDFDTVAYWTLQNLAVGNRALINAAASRYSITNLELVAMLNRVRSEVAQAYARSVARYAQISINERAVRTGQQGFREDFLRVQGREGLPIEVLNNLRLLARARMEYLASIIEFNRAQYELYVALGQPPASALSQPLPPPNPQPAGP